MSSINDRATVDEIIAANGSDGITHIIEYQNIFDGATTWKLCNGEGNFISVMDSGAFINPKLIWSKHSRMEP